jgi:O-succinylbenzoic acid--CoA ligase
VPSLRALDLPLGPALVDALAWCIDNEVAFCVLDQRLSPTRAREQLEWLGATEVFDGAEVRTLRDGREVDAGVALAMLTSGSSGRPKTALHTWASLRASARITQATLRGDDEPRWHPCLPANHIGGLAVLLRSLLDDATLVWADSPEEAQRQGATHISVVRAQWARHDLSNYHCVLLGGAKPPGDLAANTHATWGMTETGSGVVYDGRPLPEVDVTVINGELCLRTPTLFSTYRDGSRPDVLDEQGVSWFPTGDGGTFENGVVRVRGRLAFVINTGGEKVWPEDLETVLARVPQVLDVAVTSVPDDEWGERVVALVVAPGCNLDDALRGVATDAIGPWAKPKEIRYVAAIPRTTNGKINRAALPYLH